MKVVIRRAAKLAVLLALFVTVAGAAGGPGSSAAVPEAVGGELSFPCKAGIWAINMPGLMLVGAGLMALGC